MLLGARSPRMLASESCIDDTHSSSLQTEQAPTLFGRNLLGRLRSSQRLGAARSTRPMKDSVATSSQSIGSLTGD